MHKTKKSMSIASKKEELTC